MSEVFSDRENDWNLIERLNAITCKNVHIFYSCTDIVDGAQIEDSKQILNSNITQYYYTLPHYLQGVNDPMTVISGFLEHNKHTILRQESIASYETVSDSIKTYNLFTSLHNGHPFGYDLSELIKPLSSKCGLLSYVQGRILNSMGLYKESFYKYNEAIFYLKDQQYNLAELFCFMAENLLRLGVDELAFGAYREAMRWDWGDLNVHRAYVRELGRRHRFDEVRAVIKMHALEHGKTPTLDAMVTELEVNISLASLSP